MKRIHFSTAKSVFSPFSLPVNSTIGQYGFYYKLDLSDYADSVDDSDSHLSIERALLKLTARSIYRLYINGDMVMHGPARTTHGYCRVDELDITDRLIDGINHIAVEVIEYQNTAPLYDRYSNDSTLESGLFIAELEVDGEILAATGRDDWQVCHIKARAPLSERISHCRESLEVYTIDDDYYTWKLGLSDFVPVVPLEDEPVYLPHDALKPNFNETVFSNLLEFGACRIDNDKYVPDMFFEKHKYIATLPERPTSDCRHTFPSDKGHLRANYCQDGLALTATDTDDFYAMWDGGESNVGFISIAVSCEQEGTIDIVHSETLEMDGSMSYKYNVVTRLHVPAGFTEFVAMEPDLVRYITVYFRGVGNVTLHKLSVLDYTYPDEHRAAFLCNDEDVNRIYNAAKKTLILNTQDIFMDCPGRERGGWLCDSLWTARAASLLLSDSLVEREFLENYLHTSAAEMGHAMFPGVYPNSQKSYAGIPGLSTWSFWLMCEICEFIRRTGDTDFRNEHKPRIAAMINGVNEFIGESGLLENLPNIFIDWSLSNNPNNQQPISTPANALYAYALIQLGETFAEPDWVTQGQKMRSVLRSALLHATNLHDIKTISDALFVDKNGNIRGKEIVTESATATTLWTGLFTPAEAPALFKNTRDIMGPAPRFSKDPNIGASNLFIGLCIRLDMLTRNGYCDKMYEDMLAIYLPQLKEGPGTLWESQLIDGTSRCHGFTAHAGVHLMRDILGLGFPLYEKDGNGTPAITIAPHICGLRWARGSLETDSGMINVYWKYDGDSFALKVSVPSGIKHRIELPREVRALDEDCVSITVDEY